MSEFKPITEKNREIHYTKGELSNSSHICFYEGDVLSALDGLREKVDVPNPYPVFLFNEIDEKTWARLECVILREFGFHLDRVSGNIGRRLFEGWKKKMLEDMAYWFDLKKKGRR